MPYGAAPTQVGRRSPASPARPRWTPAGCRPGSWWTAKQAQRREKQGDVWYSAKMPDGTYAQVLRIPKGEKAPAVLGM